MYRTYRAEKPRFLGIVSGAGGGQMRIFGVAVAMLVMLAGCVSSGTKVTAEQAGQFQKGVTTRAQVIGRLGAPNSSSVLNDGRRIDVYVHIQASADAASYVPVVGLMAGGASSSSTTATFTYDAGGVLQTVSTSEGQNHVKTGLANQN